MARHAAARTCAPAQAHRQRAARARRGTGDDRRRRLRQSDPEMVHDATIAAAQIEFYAGLVTEMKGTSIPMGPGVVNFSVREPRGVVGRIIPFNHPFMFCAGKSRRAARDRQHRGDEAAGTGAAVVAASCRTDRRHLAARRVQRRARRPRGRRRARLASRRRDDRADRLGADRTRGDEGGVRYAQGGDARTRRQERADRLPRRRSRRGRRRRHRRHELHLVRAIAAVRPAAPSFTRKSTTPCSPR